MRFAERGLNPGNGFCRCLRSIAQPTATNQPPIDTNPPDRTQHQQQGSDFRQGRGRLFFEEVHTEWQVKDGTHANWPLERFMLGHFFFSFSSGAKWIFCTWSCRSNMVPSLFQNAQCVVLQTTRMYGGFSSCGDS